MEGRAGSEGGDSGEETGEIVLNYQNMSLPFYHFVLSLPDSVNAIIHKNKIEAKRIIGDYPSANAKAHITINNFPRKPKYIHGSALLSLRPRVNLLPTIVLLIDGYDYFENANNFTIYARIKWDHKTTRWFSKLWKIVGKCSDKPHITIARAISRQQFEKLLPLFRDREINKWAKINRLTILETAVFDEIPSKIFFEFEFKGVQETFDGGSVSETEKKRTDKSNEQLQLFGY
jgi:2'-5' RNA ligase